MSNRISTILMMTLLGLAVLIAVELRGGVPSPDAIHVPAAEDPAGGGPGAIGRSMPPLDVFSETVSRPLFVDTRRPPDDEPVDAPEPPPVAAPSDLRFSVSAIVITESERSVLLSYPPGGPVTRVTEGETVAGWRLERVESDRAIFTKDGESREATLRTFGPPPPAAQRRLTSPGQVPGASSDAARTRLEALRRRAGQAPRDPASRD